MFTTTMVLSGLLVLPQSGTSGPPQSGPPQSGKAESGKAQPGKADGKQQAEKPGQADKPGQAGDPASAAKPASDPAPDPKEAAHQIDEALKQGGMPAVATIVKLGQIPARPVTQAVGEALKHKDPAIRLAAIQALRFNKEKSALTELLGQRRNRGIIDDDEIAEEYYLSLGQHEDKRALPVLVQDLKATGRRDPVVKAKVLALGRIREWGSIDALVKFLRTSRRSDAVDAAEVALSMLTGQKSKRGWVAWARWWKDNRAKFRFSDRAPELSKRQAQLWTEAWQPPGSESSKRPRRREKESKTGGEEAGRAAGAGAGAGPGAPGRPGNTGK